MAGLPANSFSPISFAFIASGIAIQQKARLYGMSADRTNSQQPSWDGRGGELTITELTPPVTDKSYWEGRYALTEIELRKLDGTKLAINDATVNISLKKEIVKTALVGLDGTIKEYINNGDYDIRINVGIVATEGGRIIDEYPAEGVRMVRDFLHVNEALELQSTFFELFEINRIVITDYSLKQETASNRQVLDIKALSDRDYQIECTEY